MFLCIVIPPFIKKYQYPCTGILCDFMKEYDLTLVQLFHTKPCYNYIVTGLTDTQNGKHADHSIMTAPTGVYKKSLQTAPNWGGSFWGGKKFEKRGSTLLTESKISGIIEIDSFHLMEVLTWRQLFQHPF
ncbi:MAG TPA: hypothetical protein DCO72_02200 [Ruminococcus sp.]|nr:hypothetical protein [Ruminococcus sp.]